MNTLQINCYPRRTVLLKSGSKEVERSDDTTNTSKTSDGAATVEGPSRT